MNQTITTNSNFSLPIANKALDISTKSWFAVAIAGQWAFAIYIAAIYLLTPVFGLDVTNFSPAPNLKHAEGMVLTAFFVHVIPAIYLSMFGIFQLIPSMRNRYRGFHRINGRIFLLLGFFGATSGLILQWSKGLETNTLASLGISINGLLIIVATFFAYKYAVAKRFDLHKRWAIHAFFLVNGVWTFRLHLMGWYMVNQGPNGNTPNVDGPMDIFLSFACYLLPMLVAELYFWGKKQRSNVKVWFSTLIVSIGAMVTMVGVGAAIMMMWIPRVIKFFNAI